MTKTKIYFMRDGIGPVLVGRLVISSGTPLGDPFTLGHDEMSELHWHSQDI